MKSTIQNFYYAFNELDAEAMVSYYHQDLTFQDPAFGTLRGERAKNMWRMLCASQNKNEFKVLAYNFEVQDEIGKARWEAFYTFGPTGRKVHNIIDAYFEFKDGKMIRHVDDFNLYRWSRRALGWKGTLIGWSPYFKSQLNAKTNHLLDKYELQQVK